MRFPNTDPLGRYQSPAVGNGPVEPKGLGTDGHKPLMRNREAKDVRPSAIGMTAGDNFFPSLFLPLLGETPTLTERELVERSRDNWIGVFHATADMDVQEFAAWQAQQREAELAEKYNTQNI